MYRMPRGTASGHRSPREWIPALALVLALAVPVGADVVVKERTVSEGLGGFADGTTDRTLIIASDRSRDDAERTTTGRLKTPAGGDKPKASVSIIRLDRDLIWQVDPVGQEYREFSFAEMRDLIEKGGAEMEQAAAAAPGQKKKDAAMTFSVDVKAGGETQSINGFPAERVLVTLVARSANPKPGQPAEAFRMVMDRWQTTAPIPGTGALDAFHGAFAQRLGMDQSLSKIPAMARQQYGGALRELAAKMKDVRGFAVRTIFTIEGPEASPGPKRTGANAGKSTPPPEAAAGVPILRSVTDVLTVSVAKAPPQSFEIPDGYTKKVEKTKQ